MRVLELYLLVCNCDAVWLAGVTSARQIMLLVVASGGSGQQG
jgi:hypothetical protein